MLRIVLALMLLAAAGSGVAQGRIDSEGGLSFLGGAQYTTAYYFRGINYEDSRLILQPYLTAYVNLPDRGAYDLTAYLGTWHSFHESPTLGDGNWFEADFFGGIDVTRDRWTLGAIYQIYTFPGEPTVGFAADRSVNPPADVTFADVFRRQSTIQEAGVKLRFDDSGLWSRWDDQFALQPYVAAYVEIANDSQTLVVEFVPEGAPPPLIPGEVGREIRDDEERAYLEIGVGPEFDTGGQMVLAFPAVLGMSLDEYYNEEDGDETFLGYSSLSAQVSMPLDLPRGFQGWTIMGRATWLHLFADSLANRNRLMGNDRDDIFILTFGVGFEQ